MRLVPVEVRGQEPGDVAQAMPGVQRWLEAETTVGVHLRFAEGTGVGYVAELLVRLAGSGDGGLRGGASC